MSVYYNEIEPYPAQWLRNLIAAGLIPAGDVDTRSIADVRPDDLRGYVQCHFFAGLGGWAYAGRFAGWPDDRPWWTGSCPCQPWSDAGPGRGRDDPRHLWPDMFRLASAIRPACLMGEQVADAAGRGWLDGVWSDLEAIDYAFRPVVLVACGIDAPQERERIYFVANPDAPGLPQREQRRKPSDPECRIKPRPAASERGGARRSWWGHRSIAGSDGDCRRIGAGVRLMAHGIRTRRAQLRTLGNSIVPQLAAEVIAAWMECEP